MFSEEDVNNIQRKSKAISSAYSEGIIDRYGGNDKTMLKIMLLRKAVVYSSYKSNSDEYNELVKKLTITNQTYGYIQSEDKMAKYLKISPCRRESTSAPVIVPPVVSAGSDKSITLPTSSTTFTGTATDDGQITSYLWAKVSGGSATLTNTNTATLTVSGVTEGSYVFRFTATDNDGLSSYDDVALTVNYTNPTVNAGSDGSIQLPTSSISRTGTASGGSGTIATTIWSQVSGPNTATITNGNTLTATFSGLIQGSYVFRLTVTNTDSKTANDTVTITVAPQPASVAWGYSDTDPSGDLAGVTLQFSKSITTNENYDLDFTAAATDKYWIIKEPANQTAKTTWNNTSFNNGTIPDFVFNTPVVIGDSRYYYTRDIATIDSVDTTIQFSS